MKSEFSPDNTHHENVKIAIDKIIGQPTDVKRKKKSEADHKRIVFNRIIEGIIETEDRSTVIEGSFMIDLTRYNKLFFDIIDDFFKLNFNKEQIKLIEFYLYDRFSPDGSVPELLDVTNKKIKLDSIDDLWNLLKSMENESK